MSVQTLQYVEPADRMYKAVPAVVRIQRSSYRIFNLSR